MILRLWLSGIQSINFFNLVLVFCLNLPYISIHHSDVLNIDFWTGYISHILHTAKNVFEYYSILKSAFLDIEKRVCQFHICEKTQLRQNRKANQKCILSFFFVSCFTLWVINNQIWSISRAFSRVRTSAAWSYAAAAVHSKSKAPIKKRLMNFLVI